MPTSVTNTLLALLTLGLTPATQGTAGPIRLSFLTERTALRDTVTILQSNGCANESCSAFQRAVAHYISTPFDFDLSQFPLQQEGFYQFESARGAVAALPQPLSQIAHNYELNCFDTTILLAGKSLHLSLRPDDLSGPFFVPRPAATNGSFTVMPVETAKAAFTLAYQAWYREASERAFPESMHDARICLTAALFRFYYLPESTTEKALPDALMSALRNAWDREGLKFPQRFEVVLCHDVGLPQHYFVTAHASLLYPRPGGYTYIEKAGGGGRFVRVDV